MSQPADVGQGRVGWTHPFLPPLGRELILASRSPRRADILRAQGLPFRVVTTEIDERAADGEQADLVVRRLALEKAHAAAAIERTAVCMGCDTVVVLDSAILGKPGLADEARAMLRRLSGRTHEVFSAVALVCPDLDFARSAYRQSRVRFRRLEEPEILRYVESAEPMDKAGAYGIQGFGAMMVDGIEGCYFNVMGLPLAALRELWLELHDLRSVPGEQ